MEVGCGAGDSLMSTMIFNIFLRLETCLFLTTNPLYIHFLNIWEMEICLELIVRDNKMYIPG